jgi:hypothetical protein
MKRLLLSIALVSTMLLSGCGNDKTIDGKHYDTYGLFNQESTRDPKIMYEVSAGSVIWAIILSETIIVPVYIIGWDLWQPVKTYPDPSPK